MSKSQTTDIFNGDIINGWYDSEAVYVAFPWATINFALEDFDGVVSELHALVVNWEGRNIKKPKRVKKRVKDWQSEIESILKDKDVDAGHLPKEKGDFFMARLVELDTIPSEKWQEFLNWLFSTIIIHESVLGAVTLAFKMGQCYQVNKEELEK